MYRTFREFVDQRDNEKHFRHKLLERLGLEDDAIPLRAIERQRLFDALSQMDLDPETINDIHTWLRKAPDSRLKDLVNQFGKSQTDQPTDQQQGDQIMGTPAQLPQQMPVDGQPAGM